MAIVVGLYRKKDGKTISKQVKYDHEDWAKTWSYSGTTYYRYHFDSDYYEFMDNLRTDGDNWDEDEDECPTYLEFYGEGSTDTIEYIPTHAFDQTVWTGEGDKNNTHKLFSKLEKIVFNIPVEHVSQYAFAHNTTLKEVVFNNGVMRIEDHAFYNFGCSDGTTKLYFGRNSGSKLNCFSLAGEASGSYGQGYIEVGYAAFANSCIANLGDIFGGEYKAPTVTINTGDDATIPKFSKQPQDEKYYYHGLMSKIRFGFNDDPSALSSHLKTSVSIRAPYSSNGYTAYAYTSGYVFQNCNFTNQLGNKVDLYVTDTPYGLDFQYSTGIKTLYLKNLTFLARQGKLKTNILPISAFSYLTADEVYIDNTDSAKAVSIPYQCFKYVTINSIILDGNIGSIGIDAFCLETEPANEQTIEFKTTMNNWYSIGDRAFKNWNITEFTIPSSNYAEEGINGFITYPKLGYDIITSANCTKIINYCTNFDYCYPTAFGYWNGAAIYTWPDTGNSFPFGSNVKIKEFVGDSAFLDLMWSRYHYTTRIGSVTTYLMLFCGASRNDAQKIAKEKVWNNEAALMACFSELNTVDISYESSVVKLLPRILSKTIKSMTLRSAYYTYEQDMSDWKLDYLCFETIDLFLGSRYNPLLDEVERNETTLKHLYKLNPDIGILQIGETKYHVDDFNESNAVCIIPSTYRTISLENFIGMPIAALSFQGATQIQNPYRDTSRTDLFEHITTLTYSGCYQTDTLFAGLFEDGCFNNFIPSSGIFIRDSKLANEIPANYFNGFNQDKAIKLYLSGTIESIGLNALQNTDACTLYNLATGGQHTFPYLTHIDDSEAVLADSNHAITETPGQYILKTFKYSSSGKKIILQCIFNETDDPIDLSQLDIQAIAKGAFSMNSGTNNKLSVKLSFVGGARPNQYRIIKASKTDFFTFNYILRHIDNAISGYYAPQLKSLILQNAHMVGSKAHPIFNTPQSYEELVALQLKGCTYSDLGDQGLYNSNCTFPKMNQFIFSGENNNYAINNKLLGYNKIGRQDLCITLNNIHSLGTECLGSIYLCDQIIITRHDATKGVSFGRDWLKQINNLPSFQWDGTLGEWGALNTFTVSTDNVMGKTVYFTSKENGSNVINYSKITDWPYGTVKINDYAFDDNNFINSINLENIASIGTESLACHALLELYNVSTALYQNGLNESIYKDRVVKGRLTDSMLIVEE